jgi:hypothetical protein
MLGDDVRERRTGCVCVEWLLLAADIAAVLIARRRSARRESRC